MRVLARPAGLVLFGVPRILIPVDAVALRVMHSNDRVLVAGMALVDRPPGFPISVIVPFGKLAINDCVKCRRFVLSDRKTS